MQPEPDEEFDSLDDALDWAKEWGVPERWCSGMWNYLSEHAVPTARVLGFLLNKSATDNHDAYDYVMLCQGDVCATAVIE